MYSRPTKESGIKFTKGRYSEHTGDCKPKLRLQAPITISCWPVSSLNEKSSAVPFPSLEEFSAKLSPAFEKKVGND